MVCVVKLEGVPQLCKTDEIGEICVSSVATGTSYYGLTGMSKNTFEVGKYIVDIYIYTKFHYAKIHCCSKVCLFFLN